MSDIEFYFIGHREARKGGICDLFCPVREYGSFAEMEEAASVFKAARYKLQPGRIYVASGSIEDGKIATLNRNRPLAVEGAELSPFHMELAAKSESAVAQVEAEKRTKKLEAVDEISHEIERLAQLIAERSPKHNNMIREDMCRAIDRRIRRRSFEIWRK